MGRWEGEIGVYVCMCGLGRQGDWLDWGGGENGMVWDVWGLSWGR